MNATEFRQLKKLMTLSVSDNDAEALASLRAAMKILARSGYTWEMALDRVIKVVDGFDDAEEVTTQEAVPQEATIRDRSPDSDMEAKFELALDEATGSFRDVLLSIHAQWETSGRLSPRQRQVVEDAAERAAERHPGGRVR